MSCEHMSCEHNWEAVHIPQQAGEGHAIWKCVKCGFQEMNEVLIIDGTDKK